MTSSEARSARPLPTASSLQASGIDPGEIEGASSLECDQTGVVLAPITLRFAPELELTDERFEMLCAANPDLLLEQSAEGALEILYPAGGESSRCNSLITARLVLWNEGRGSDKGVCFDSSVAFKLPSGAKRGPDASWVARERWDALTTEQRKAFPPICPDFVAELRPPTDSKTKLRKKMNEYIKNGARLGWLIDPIDRTIEVYRPGRAVEIMSRPDQINGGDILPGFVLELADFINP